MLTAELEGLDKTRGQGSVRELVVTKVSIKPDATGREGETSGVRVHPWESRPISACFRIDTAAGER